MNHAIQLLAALAGTLGFAMLFNLHGKPLIYASLGGLFSWAVYLLVEFFNPNPYLCAFISSAALTLYAEVMARRFKSPTTIFLVIAIIPLVPGAALYRSVNYMLQGLRTLAQSESMHTLIFAASMSAGITLTSLVARFLHQSLFSAHRGQ